VYYTTIRSLLFIAGIYEVHVSFNADSDPVILELLDSEDQVMVVIVNS